MLAVKEATLSHEPSPPASILVVDDTVENLRLLVNMLGQAGYEVRPATGGRQALRAAELNPPDLILLDINMPDMNGHEVCRRLKGQESLRDIPVVFLTALNDVSEKVDAFNAGAADYVTKPFHVEEVLARVKTHLALQQSHRDLRALEQLRDNLVHMVVHDMRSPLTALLGYLSLLQDAATNGLGDEAAADLRAAIDAANVVRGMANELLDVSRLEEGKMPIERTPCDLASMASDARQALAGLDKSARIEVCAEGPIEAKCDEAIIRRVFENLVNNAIKHAPRGGRVGILVTAAPDGRRVRVEVTDEGPGVPPGARQQIFEKFGTVVARRDQAYHSAGLGLAFCKLAVEAHGGAIGVDAGDPGGSVFWFELPT